MAEPEFTIGEALVRPRAATISFAGKTARLEPRLMQVLIALHRAFPDVATRRMLSELAWSDVVVGEDALNRCIARLRKHLTEIGAPLRIETTPKIGYQLVVEACFPASAATTEAATAASRAPEPDPSPATMRFRRMWPASAIALGFAAILAVSVGIGLTSRAPSSQAFALGEVTRIGGADTREFDPALSPDGLMLAYAKGDHAATTSALYLRPAAGGVERLLNDDEGVINPAWSPNGSEIAYVRVRAGSPCTLVVAAVATGAHRDVGACRIAEGSAPAWSTDGQQLFFHDQFAPSSPFAIFSLNLSDGAATPVTRPTASPGDIFASPSPDGTRLAFLRETAWRSGQIIVRDLATGVERQVSQTASDVYGIAWEPGETALLVTSNLGGDVGLWRAPLEPGPVTRMGGAGVNYSSVAVGGGNRIAVELSERRVRLERIGATGVRRAIGDETGIHGDSDPDIAADGTLAFVSYRSGRSQLWIAPEGQAPRQLTQGGLDYLGGPRFSPDGSAIAASVAQGGQQDIVVFDREGRARPITDDQAIDILPQWIESGAAVLFLSDRGGTWSVWRAPRDGADATMIQENARLAVMGDNGGLLYQPTDKPGLWYQPAETTTAQPVSPASLSPLARLHFANGAYWILDRAEGRTMQIWRFTPSSGLTAVSAAAGPFYPKSQIAIDPNGDILVAILTGVDNDVLVADLVRPTARGPQHPAFGRLALSAMFAAHFLAPPIVVATSDIVVSWRNARR